MNIRDNRLFRLGAVALITVGVAFGTDHLKSRNDPDELLTRYLAAARAADQHVASVSMTVDIEAALPKLHRRGMLHGLKFVSKAGRIVYDKLHFDGDEVVKRQVIVRYLNTETEAASDTGSLSVTPVNYRFRYERTADYNGRTALVFQVRPRLKRVGLYDGELWLDSQTALPLREWGQFVKNPSIFVRKVYFVRDYFIIDGGSHVARLISDIETRIVGRVELTARFSNFTRQEAD